jgi:hypothetical protein
VAPAAQCDNHSAGTRPCFYAPGRGVTSSGTCLLIFMQVLMCKDPVSPRPNQDERPVAPTRQFQAQRTANKAHGMLLRPLRHVR